MLLDTPDGTRELARHPLRLQPEVDGDATGPQHPGRLPHVEHRHGADHGVDRVVLERQGAAITPAVLDVVEPGLLRQTGSVLDDAGVGIDRVHVSRDRRRGLRCPTGAGADVGDDETGQVDECQRWYRSGWRELSESNW